MINSELLIINGLAVKNYKRAVPATVCNVFLYSQCSLYLPHLLYEIQLLFHWGEIYFLFHRGLLSALCGIFRDKKYCVSTALQLNGFITAYQNDNGLAILHSSFFILHSYLFFFTSVVEKSVIICNISVISVLFFIRAYAILPYKQLVYNHLQTTPPCGHPSNEGELGHSAN